MKTAVETGDIIQRSGDDNCVWLVEDVFSPAGEKHLVISECNVPRRPLPETRYEIGAKEVTRHWKEVTNENKTTNTE